MSRVFSFRQITLLVFLKFLLLLLVAALVPLVIPYKGLFSFPETLAVYSLPKFVESLAHFDGIHYLLIADSGYYEFGHAFFPLFPMVIKILSPIFLGNRLIAGLAVSNMSFIVGLWLLQKWLHAHNLKKESFWIITVLLCFPTAFFFQSVYTEGLFFVLVVATLYCLQSKKLMFTAIAAVLAGLTRVTGVFLIAPLFVAALSAKKLSNWFIVATPAIGLGMYLLYLHYTTGDWLAFLHAQSAFGAGRTVGFVLLPQVFYRYLKIFLTADMTFAYFMAVVEMILFSGAFATAALEGWRNYVKKEWQLFSVAVFSASVLLLPTVTGTFLSTPRFALLSLSSFIFVARLKSKTLKTALLVVFGLLQIVLFGYFVQGYFVS